MLKLPNNIIIVNDFDYINGGAAKVAIDWARILKEKGHNIIFFSAVHQEQDKVDGVRYVCTNQAECLKDPSKLKGALRGLYNKKAYRDFKNLLAEYSPKDTIVYIHGWIKALSCSIWNAARERGFDVQVTAHDYFLACPNGGFYNYQKNEICHYRPMSLKCILCNCDSRNYAFKLYRCARTFIQNSLVNVLKKTKRVNSISDFSENILKPFIPQNVEIERIANPIDKHISEEKIDFSKNDYFLFVGRVSKEKGCDIFCQAIDDCKVKGVVVGDGPELSAMKDKFANANIEFVGWKSRSEVFEFMKKARALVFPSRWYEAAPLTVPEALTIGLPCVVSNCCAARDYIDDAAKGRIFESLDELKKCLIEYA